MKTHQYWIEKLNLTAHPEGGYFSESFVSPDKINNRKLWTSIYFLLTENEVSSFHKLTADEMWYFHAGSALTIYMITPDGQLITQKLGLNIENGEIPQFVVPKGYIFGSSLNDSGYSLVGCMVSPGFEFEDFKLFSKDELMSLYPNHADIIKKLACKSL